MDFILSEDQRMLRDTVRRIAEEKFAPLAEEIDEKERFPLESVKVLAENGLLGIQIPEEYGGAGAGMLAMVLAVEEIARVCASTSVILTTQALASDPFLLAGTEEQKKNYLYRLASGACLGACGITEPGAGSDVTGMKTTAKKVDGGYILNGAKIFITNGGESDIITVLAYTDKEKGNRGISMLIVEKGDAGFSVGKKEHKLGLHGSDTRELVFEDVFLRKRDCLARKVRASRH
jgi:alkylation response protein AidB-like acyl-CoA dehydrogenase